MPRTCPRCGAPATHPTLCLRCGARVPPDPESDRHRDYRRLWIVTLVLLVILFAVCVVLAYSTELVVTGT